MSDDLTQAVKAEAGVVVDSCNVDTFAIERRVDTGIDKVMDAHTAAAVTDPINVESVVERGGSDSSGLGSDPAIVTPTKSDKKVLKLLLHTVHFHFVRSLLRLRFSFYRDEEVRRPSMTY